MENNGEKTKLIKFKSIGSSNLGYISVAEEFNDVPFQIKRTYWTYYTPQNVLRGGHANIDKEMVIIAVSGSIEIEVELKSGFKNTYLLNSPDEGLYLPKLCWHTMKYSHNAVQLVLASNLYSEDDYVRDYQEFKNYGKNSSLSRRTVE